MEPLSRKARNAEQQKKRRDQEKGAINGLRNSLAAFHHVDGILAARMEKAEVLRCILNDIQELKKEQRNLENITIENNRFRASLALAANDVSNMLDAVPNTSRIKNHLLGFLSHKSNNGVAAKAHQYPNVESTRNQTKPFLKGGRPASVIINLQREITTCSTIMKAVKLEQN